MKSIIVGTAGHIDHGKTALVKALTGIDADRLKEEKRRGITIDLGFAHMDLPAIDGGTLRLGFVDVPGHERFVRNMLAGVGGIDMVLLVIAADEAIMPQTREHFDILQLLGVRRGLVVLTKSDLVDPDTLEVARLEAAELVRGSFLEDATGRSIVAVSSLTGDGLNDLKRAMAAMAAEVRQRDHRALLRLPIDRVFTMKGFGTIVTGTLVSGTVQIEDELEVFPAGRRVRVRGVQVHGAMANAAVAGQRTALNLGGISTADLARGMTLAPPATFHATRFADVRLKLLASAPRPLKNRAEVHLHALSMESVAEVLFDSHGPANQIAPGGEAFARLRLPSPVLLLPGDRFIIRQFSPVVTIGGGVVLDASPMPRAREREAFLKILAANDSSAILRARIVRRGKDGISAAQLVSETGWTRGAIAELVDPMLKTGEIVRAGDFLVNAMALDSLRQQILAAAAGFHKKNPLAGGMSKEELRALFQAKPEVFENIIGRLAAEKKLEIAGDRVSLPGQGVVMKDDEAESRKKIEAAFATAGLKVPALQEVLAALTIDRTRAQKIVTLLLRDKVLTKVSDDLVFHRDALADLRRRIAAHKARSAKIDVAQFKEMTGVTRKYAIPLLEYLDRERVTRRAGDVREIL